MMKEEDIKHYCSKDVLTLMERAYDAGRKAEVFVDCPYCGCYQDIIDSLGNEELIHTCEDCGKEFVIKEIEY